jgi:serine/threonine protein phosphatase PrpC
MNTFAEPVATLLRHGKANGSPTLQAGLFSKNTVLEVATATLACPTPPPSSEQQKIDVLQDILVGAFFALGHAMSITVTEQGDLCNCNASPATIGMILLILIVAHVGDARGTIGAGGQYE